MFSTANYTSIAKCCKAPNTRPVLFLLKMINITCGEDELFCHLHFLPHCFGAKVQLTSSPFLKLHLQNSIDNIENLLWVCLGYSLSYPKLQLQNSIDNIENPSVKLIWRNWAGGTIALFPTGSSSFDPQGVSPFTPLR